MSHNPSVAPSLASPPATASEPQTPEAKGVQGERFLALVADRLAAVEDILREQLASDVPFIEDAAGYLVNGGGKRVRPALLLLASQMLEAESDEDLTYAAVVELIHTASLIHDDIIDNAELRRGRTAAHRVWDTSRTVLLGDWLYTTSMRTALSHDRLEIVRRLCDAVLRMTEGELLVLERLGAADVTVDEYFDVIERKTAHLFAAACSIPALKLDGGGAATALGEYGRSLGLCFQLVDDLLDFTSDQETLGKPVLSDLTGGKLTLPLVLLLPRLDSGRRRWIEWILEDREFRRVDTSQILELVQAHGTLDEVREMAASYASAAQAALEGFPASDARDALEFAPEFILDRRA